MTADVTLLVRAELLKLLKQKAVWITIAAAAAFTCWIQWHSGSAQEGWQQGAQAAQVQLRAIGAGHGCLVVTGVPGQACGAAQIAAARQALTSELAQATSDLRWGAAGLSPLGAVLVSLGLLGTGVGFVLGVAIAAIAVEAETRSGGLKATLLAASSRRQVVLATAVACYLCTVAGALGTTAATVGISALQGSLRPLGASAAPLSGPGAPSVWILLLATAVTPAVGIAAALALGLLGQSSLVAVGGVTALVVIDRVIATAVPGIAPYTLVGAIGKITSALAQSRLAAASVTVTLWPSQILHGGVPWGFLEILVIAGLGLWVAVMSLQRREIR